MHPRVVDWLLLLFVLARRLYLRACWSRLPVVLVHFYSASPRIEFGLSSMAPSALRSCC